MEPINLKPAENLINQMDKNGGFYTVACRTLTVHNGSTDTD
jgi:hypothetical protein